MGGTAPGDPGRPSDGGAPAGRSLPPGRGVRAGTAGGGGVSLGESAGEILGLVAYRYIDLRRSPGDSPRQERKSLQTAKGILTPRPDGEIGVPVPLGT